MQFHIWKVVTSRAFEYMIFAFITLNTITLAMQVSRRSCEAGVGVDHTQLVVFLKKLKNHDFYSVKFYRIFFKSTYWLPKVEEMFWCNKKSGVTELIFEIITRATYGGTESRFTDGSVVVFFFFSSRAFAIGCARTQYFSIGSNFFCQPGVVALAGSLSCYRKSNILNYLIGNVAGKYLVKCKFAAILKRCYHRNMLLVTVAIAYILTVFDALKIILYITLVSFSYEKSMHTFWGWNLNFSTFQETIGRHLKVELNPKIKFVIFERTLKITEKVIFQFLIPLLRFWDISVSLICKLHIVYCMTSNDISENVTYLDLCYYKTFSHDTKHVYNM